MRARQFPTEPQQSPPSLPTAPQHPFKHPSASPYIFAKNATTAWKQPPIRSPMPNQKFERQPPHHGQLCNGPPKPVQQSDPHFPTAPQMFADRLPQAWQRLPAAPAIAPKHFPMNAPTAIQAPATAPPPAAALSMRSGAPPRCAAEPSLRFSSWAPGGGPTAPPLRSVFPERRC